MKTNQRQKRPDDRGVRGINLEPANPIERGPADSDGSIQDVTLPQLAETIDIVLNHTLEILGQLHASVVTQVKRWFEAERLEPITLLEKARAQISLIQDVIRFNHPIVNIYRKYHDDRFQFVNYLKNSIRIIEVLHLHSYFLQSRFRDTHEFEPGITERSMTTNQFAEYSNELALFCQWVEKFYQEAKGFEKKIAIDLGTDHEGQIKDYFVSFIPPDQKAAMAKVLTDNIAMTKSTSRDPLIRLHSDVLDQLSRRVVETRPDHRTLPEDVQRVLHEATKHAYMTRAMLIDLFSPQLPRLNAALTYLQDHRLVRISDTYLHGERFYFPT